MKKTTLSAVVVAVIAASIGGAFAYRSHARTAEIDSMRPAVNLTSAYVSQVLQADTKPSSMTFGEFFSKTNQALEEIDKKEIELKSQDIKYAVDERATALAYMASAQEAIRGESALYHKKSDVKFAFSQTDDAIAEMTSASTSDNPYSFKYARERADKALERAKKSASELTDAQNDLVTSLKAVRAASENATQTFASKDTPAADIDAALKANAPAPASGTAAPKTADAAH
ncbi:hypothetical protein VSR34_01165 [Paraburkholderia sp. JHI2823]|uniref:hypothetical protein n=1 Tax=Paraburkholderia sp. JHI2823 TaxID=3112960 RepID=UPI0031794B12